jgi:thiol-disulfide isomerase/thioredoxin
MKHRLLLPAALLTLSLPLVAADTPAPAAAAAPAAGTQDATTTKAADDSWKEMEKLQKPPSQKPTSREEALQQIKQWFGTQKEAAEAFAEKFPNDPRSWNARMMALRANMQMRRYTGDKSDPVADQQKLNEIINAPAAPATVKGEAAFMSVMIIGSRLSKESPEGFPAFYKAAADFFEKYPTHPLAEQLKSIQMQALNEDPTPEGTAMLKKLAAGSDPRLAEAASSTLERKEKQAELRKKPVDLKFTAVDGQPVDLANLRGKVVLIDFWASWCGPCMGEMPNVVSTYGKLHEKGFEILGISLDQEKEAMEGALKKQNMTWMQYFDGAGWQNKISTSFGIQSIPAAWLIDKKGMLRQTNLRGDALGEAVEKLLAE